MESDLLVAWNTFQSDLRRFVYSKVRDRAMTDDIVHDVFLKIHRKIDSLRDHTRFRSWIYTLTNHMIVDHYRAKSRYIDPALFDDEGAVSNFNECVSNYMKKLIVALPQKYREAIQLTELGDMSQCGLADHLGISVPGAKSRVQRARALLKKRLHEHLYLETDRYGNVLACECRAPHSC